MLLSGKSCKNFALAVSKLVPPGKQQHLFLQQFEVDDIHHVINRTQTRFLD